jgi:poly-beta-1,6-N-acetyl-D-glucosamine synthase
VVKSDPDHVANSMPLATGGTSATRYAIVTPVRDEEEHIERTLEAMIAQTLLPVRWVVVNDGSSDHTGTIAEAYAERHSWIHVVHRPDRGRRQNGSGVIEAFNEGYRHLDGVEWDYIVKLDGDLSFASDYFERCFVEFAQDVSLGIGGGTLYDVLPDGPKHQPHPTFHVRGATKIYRRACWEQLGGLWSGPGWDTIDEVKANMLGWTTRTFRGIPVSHHRVTGAAEGGWRDNFKNGRGSYAAGYHPLFVFARCANRLFHRPYALGAAAMLYGFLSGYWRHTARQKDAELIRYARKQQLNRLLRRPTIWR